MKKPPVFQVRISPKLGKEIEDMRQSFQFRMSRPAFVEVVLRAGIPIIKKQIICSPSDLARSFPESSWAKESK